MPNLNVQVVNSRNNPISGAKVFVLIHHNFMPDTWLEKYTDRDGQAAFDISRFTRVDVYVNGNLELVDISIAQSNKGVTVSI